MSKTRQQSGFTAVELLITLFVAAAFLIAAYQLFNLVIKDGGATRAQSRAANVAYDYLRQYASSSTTIPCTASSPLSDSPLSIDGLVDASISIDVTCLPDAINSLSKVTATITYNHPAQTVAYATYVSSTGNSGSSDITNGLAAWWKLDGDTNNSVGSPNGVNSNATSTTGQGGNPDTAYSFNGTNSGIQTNSVFGLGTTNVTISCWVYNPTTTNSGMFVKVGNSGFGVGIGNTSFDNSSPGSKLVMIYEGVRWIPTSTTIGTGWHHIAMVIDSSGTPTGYVDGVSTGAYPGASSYTPGSADATYIGGSTAYSRWFTGSIDDVRIYNRALPLSDIISLYSAGAQ